MKRCDIVRRKMRANENALRWEAGGRLKMDPVGSFGLDRSLASDVRDIAAADAEVAEFTVRHTAEFVDGLTVLAPVVKRACQVHVITPFLGFLLGGRSSLAPPRSDGLKYTLHRRKEQSCYGTAPMRFVHVKQKFWQNSGQNPGDSPQR